MRKICLFIIVCLAFSSGCSDFLKEEDKDQMIPRTVEHFSEILHREAFIESSQSYATDMMTDDVEEYRKASSQEKNTYKSMYTWQRDVEIDGNGETSNVNNTWEFLFRVVLMTNYVMENIDNAIGEENEKAFVRGEALFVRARCYFELVNLYAKHYDKATAGSEPGVPKRLGTGVEDTYKRASVKDIYTQIEEDLKGAIDNFEKSGLKKSLWHPNALTAKLLLSRVYLYESDWENCITYATEVIDGSGGMLWNLSEHQGTFVNTMNPEILHSYGDRSSLIPDSEMAIPKIYGGFSLNYGVSKEMEGIFLEGDLREKQYIRVVSGMGVPAKWDGSFTSLGAFNFRVSEAYLNRAEAYAGKDQDDEAYKDVEFLVSNRVASMLPIFIPKEGLELKRFIFNERRRELCFEGHRWYDLKRTKHFMKQIDHKFTLVSNMGVIMGVEVYMLAPNDPNYLFPIPKEEINRNGVMQPNNRVEKLPILED